MRKRTIRGLVVGLAGLLVLALGSAHADVSVTIATEDGATVFSLPAEGDVVQYPDGIETKVNGTAGFGSTDGTVLYQFSTSSGGDEIPSYAGEAALECNEDGSACTWSFSVPWILPPSDYKLTVKAVEPDPANPDGELSQVTSINVTVL